MADTTDDQAIPQLSGEVVDMVAAMAKEIDMLRDKCNMPKSTRDYMLPLQRLFGGLCTQLAKDATERRTMQNTFEARLKKVTDGHIELQNLVYRLAGSVNIPKHQSGLMLQNGDYDALADYLEVRIDQTVAAQNGRNVRGDGHHRVWLRKEFLDEYIQNDKKLHALTLLKPMMFEYIVYKAEEYIEAHGGKLYYDCENRKSDPGNRSKLPIRYEVFIAFYKKRTNDPPEVVGALFGMDRTTVERQSEYLDHVLEQVVPGTGAMGKRLRAIETSEEYLKFTGGKIMHDGTITQALDSTDPANLETSGYSGKRKMPGFNDVFSCIYNGILVAQTGNYPGNWHDMRVFTSNLPDLGLFNMREKPRNEEAAEVMRVMVNYMDKGFEGIKNYCEHINAEIPAKGKNKKSPKELQEAYRSGDKKAIAEALGLSVEQHDKNREISSERSIIERMIGRLKRWKILSGVYRGTASSLTQQYEILSGVVNLEILWPEIEQKEGPLLAMLAARRERHKVQR